MSNNVCKAIIEGSLEVKLPTIWTDEKQRWEESEKRREEERRSQKRKSQKKEDPGARKGRKIAKHCVFPMICGSGGSKSRLAKAAGAEPAGQMRDEKLHVVVARSTFPSQNVKKHQVRSTFLHSVTWIKFGASHFRVIAKGRQWADESKLADLAVQDGSFLTVHFVLQLKGGGSFEKCTPLWREAHFEVKSAKN